MLVRDGKPQRIIGHGTTGLGRTGVSCEEMHSAYRNDVMRQWKERKVKERSLSPPIIKPLSIREENERRRRLREEQFDKNIIRLEKIHKGKARSQKDKVDQIELEQKRLVDIQCQKNLNKICKTKALETRTTEVAATTSQAREWRIQQFLADRRDIKVAFDQRNQQVAREREYHLETRKKAKEAKNHLINIKQEEVRAERELRQRRGEEYQKELKVLLADRSAEIRETSRTARAKTAADREEREYQVQLKRKAERAAFFDGVKPILTDRLLRDRLLRQEVRTKRQILADKKDGKNSPLSNKKICMKRFKGEY